MAEELSTRILIEIRDGIRDVGQCVDQTNQRLDQTNQRLAVLAKITQGIDTRLERIENERSFLPRRVDILEEKVERLEAAIDPPK